MFARKGTLIPITHTADLEKYFPGVDVSAPRYITV